MLRIACGWRMSSYTFFKIATRGDDFYPKATMLAPEAGRCGAGD